MMIEILYSIAVDKCGKLVHVANAQKGSDYFCPVCGKVFILRKSGNTGRGSRRPHFAHNELSPNCKPETVLHYSFKEMLIGLLEEYRLRNEPYPLNWKCRHCGRDYTGNLLNNVASFRKEYVTDSYRPDIALLDREGSIFAAVEIVVTHKPEESVLKYYRENGIVLIQIDLLSDEDLTRVDELAANPSIVDYCMNPQCETSRNHKLDRTIHVRRVRCARCLYPSETYHIEIRSVFGKTQSLDFTEDEIALVKANRENIAVKFNQKTKERYPALVCTNCRRIQRRYSRRRPRW